jgi:hypothetical protein
MALTVLKDEGIRRTAADTGHRMASSRQGVSGESADGKRVLLRGCERA